MRVLITGAAGFIGANLVRRFITDGWEVVGLDDLSRGRAEYLADVEEVDLHIGDVLDKDLCARLLKRTDAVVHLAAQTGVQESIDDPLRGLRVNVESTLTLLIESARQNVGTFILASTGGAIAGNQEPPLREDTLPTPISSYGASKLAAEAYAHVFANTCGLSTASLRFSNVYGPFSTHKANAVPAFVQALLADREIEIYGDGENTRDFLFVADLVDAILCATKAKLTGQAIHLGTGRETSINSLLDTLAGISGHRARPEYLPARLGEVRRNYADPSLARSVLGFEARTSLEEGLRITWDWFADPSRESA